VGGWASRGSRTARGDGKSQDEEEGQKAAGEQQIRATVRGPAQLACRCTRTASRHDRGAASTPELARSSILARQTHRRSLPEAREGMGFGPGGRAHPCVNLRSPVVFNSSIRHRSGRLGVRPGPGWRPDRLPMRFRAFVGGDIRHVERRPNRMPKSVASVSRDACLC
jgi:hypothetical protein